MIKGSNDEWALKMMEEYEEHGLTSGVPAEAWDWVVNHPFYSQSRWFKSGAVFATTKAKDAVKEAQDRGRPRLVLKRSTRRNCRPRSKTPPAPNRSNQEPLWPS